jgi:hypothetical protein
MPEFNKPSDNITAVSDGTYYLRLFVQQSFALADILYSKSAYNSWVSPVITVRDIAQVFNSGTLPALFSTPLHLEVRLHRFGPVLARSTRSLLHK